jgi:hypothetical protein
MTIRWNKALNAVNDLNAHYELNDINDANYSITNY